MVIRNTSECVGFNSSGDGTFGTLYQGLELWHMYLVFFLLCGVGLGLAKLFNAIRQSIFEEKNSVDADFDAGGKISVGITASTIVSQWTWAATLLQSSSVASKYGISGPFWYAAGASIQILLFAMLSVQLKIRAPGAKTFLQVIRARFGPRTHIVFCVFGLLTNTIVTAMLMLGGSAVMTSLVKGLSIELALALVAVVTGSYTYVGGLGATFYVSYFNAVIIFIVMLIFFGKVYNDTGEDNVLGSVEKLHHLLQCAEAPEGNLERSHLTMVSNPGLMFGIINIVGNFGTVFVDQSYWQSSVAAKPKQGVYGFLTGGLIWFTIPFTFATTMGLAYSALSVNNGAPLLTDQQVNEGLVAPMVAQSLLGNTGEFMILIMVLMAVTSTGSSEIIAVTSILVYDIYQIYLKPYRLTNDANSCILCGGSRGRMANPRDKCVCVSMTYCQMCKKDDVSRKDFVKRALKPAYRCETHGKYREYNDYLIGLKNWCILWVTIAGIFLTLFLNQIEISLGWVYLFMGILVGSAVIPIALCMFWSRLTGLAMSAGAISGTVLALITWLTVASALPGGLTKFITNTGDEISMLAGNLCAIFTGGLITVVVSLVQMRGREINVAEVWETTRDIDNPLNPWTEVYAKELNFVGMQTLDNRPSLGEVENTFKGSKHLAVFGSMALTVVLVVVWPAISSTAGVLNLTHFTVWIGLSGVWGVVGAAVVILMPVISEIWEALKIFRENKVAAIDRYADQQHPNGSYGSRKSISSRNKFPTGDGESRKSINSREKSIAEEDSASNTNGGIHQRLSVVQQTTLDFIEDVDSANPSQSSAVFP